MLKYLAVAVLAQLFRLVQRNVPEPYMDEIFHIPQAQRYAAGDWTWDPMITTPPGLYVVGSSVCYLLQSEECSPMILRSVNLAALVVGAFTFAFISGRRDLLAVVLTSPLVAFYANIYYTDVLAAVFVLLALSLARQNRHILAATMLLVSLTFRQTNIVFVGLAGAIALNPGSQSSIGLQFSSMFANLWKPARWMPYLAVVSAAAAFVVQNGGITLGDKENHAMRLNLPQFLYFALFATFSTAPLALSSGWFRKYCRSLLKCLRRPLRLIRYLIELASIGYIIMMFSEPHPFVLSDNRHYTFYLWRRVLHRPEHPALSLIMAPVYHACLAWLFSGTPFNIEGLAFWVCVGCALVPSPLLEPRYYALPTLIWRTIIAPYRGNWLETFWGLSITVATVCVFCWSDTHFMW